MKFKYAEDLDMYHPGFTEAIQKFSLAFQVQADFLQSKRPEMSLEVVPRNVTSIRILLRCGRIRPEATEVSVETFG